MNDYPKDWLSHVEKRLIPRLERRRRGCWLWPGASSARGYGRFSLNARLVHVHRLMKEWSLRRRLRDDEVIDHLCRTPACARPDHLDVVTQAVNVQRGRNAKLTAGDVAEIRRRRAAGESTVALGHAFGVTQAHASRICLRRRWA